MSKLLKGIVFALAAAALAAPIAQARPNPLKMGDVSRPNPMKSASFRPHPWKSGSVQRPHPWKVGSLTRVHGMNPMKSSRIGY